MKITKSQLKEIIKEELEAVLSEDELEEVNLAALNLLRRMQVKRQKGPGASSVDTHKRAIDAKEKTQAQRDKERKDKEERERKDYDRRWRASLSPEDLAAEEEAEAFRQSMMEEELGEALEDRINPDLDDLEQAGFRPDPEEVARFLAEKYPDLADGRVTQKIGKNDLMMHIAQEYEVSEQTAMQVVEELIQEGIVGMYDDFVNIITADFDEDYDDSMDGDFDSAMASAGYGTDEDYGFYGESIEKMVREEMAKVILEKDDRCTRIAKSKYDVWPSAYASGAVVRCRDGKIWKDLKEEDAKAIEPQIRKVLKDEGGAAGLDAIVKAVDADEAEVKATLKAMVDVGLHKNGDYILEDEAEIDVEKTIDEKKKKAGTESSKESSLRDWFGRKGAKGKKGGWVDCNAPDGDGGYKACGREDGEKRSKYPACRPTPSACKEKGKGKSWGKKAKKEGLKMNKQRLMEIITEEYENVYYEYLAEGETLEEAEYQGRKVTLNKPMKGDVKKSKVYVKNAKGNVVKVNFGDPNMKIKKNIPARRKSFRARHNCDNPGPKWKARYWSCKAW
jgi:hypothetical protein